MENYAKSRLKLLLDIMRTYDWASYHFPGGNTIRCVPLLILLERGKELDTKSVPERMMEPGQCWGNAKTCSEADPTLEYWEGMIADQESAWPTPHAWNMRNGAIVDATVDSSKFDYFGVRGNAF